MTRTTRLVSGLVFLLGASPLVAQDGAVRSISVSGTVETKTAPDLIVWRVNLSDANKDLATAKAQSDVKVRSVLALREKLDIEQGDQWRGPMSNSISVSDGIPALSVPSRCRLHALLPVVVCVRQWNNAKER